MALQLKKEDLAGRESHRSDYIWQLKLLESVKKK